MTTINKLIISIFLSILFLTGCSDEEIPVLVNGVAQNISQDIFDIISKTNQNAVKSIIPFENEPDITIEYQGISHKVFILNQNGIVYFKDNNNAVFQYEINKVEIDLLSNVVK